MHLLARDLTIELPFPLKRLDQLQENPKKGGAESRAESREGQSHRSLQEREHHTGPSTNTLGGREGGRQREREGERARGRKQTCGLQSRGAPRCGSPPRTQRGSNRRCRAWRRWLRQRERSWRRPVLKDRQGGAEADRRRVRERQTESESARK